MATTQLLSGISRSETYPKYVDVAISKNSGYISITPDDWTAQMFYELPFIKFDIYTRVNSKYVKYTKNSISVHTFGQELMSYPNTPVCYSLKNIPQTFTIAITPVFDTSAVKARNDLIINGIESGDLWNTTTDSFNIDISFIED